MMKSTLLSRTLWLFSLTLAALTGCGGKSSGSSGSAYAAFDFRVYDLNGSTPVTCADVGAAQVVTTLVNVATNEQFTNSFPCNDATWAYTIPAVPVGDYYITYELHSATPTAGNTLLDIQTFPASSTDSYHLARGTSTLEGVDFMVNAFDVAWGITKGGVSASCGQVGGTTVRLDVMYPSATQATSYYFDCVEYEGLTMGIPVSDTDLSYPVTWKMVLLNAANQTLGSTQSFSYTVSYDKNALLPAVTFSL